MKRLLALLGVVTVLFAIAAPPASAADALVLRKVDTSQYPTIKITALVSGAQTPDLASFNVRENGRLLDNVTVSPIGKSAVPTGVVLAIDTSGSMNSNGAIDQARAAAKQFVAQKQPNDQIAVVSFSDAPRTVVDFTSDANQLNAAIDALVGRGETALWDGVRQSLALYGARTDLLPNVVVLSDGKDTVSQGTFDQARGSAKSLKAAVFAVGLKGGDFDPGPVRSLAEETGGQYLETTDPKALSAAYGQIQKAIQNQYEISYQSPSKAETLDIDIAAGSLAASVRGIPSNVQGVVTAPKFVEESNAPGFLTSSWSGALVAALVILAVALFAYGFFLIFVRERTVERALQPYTEGVSGDDEDGSRRTDGLVDSAFLKRAVRATADIARERGVLQRVEEMLERADLPLQASEALFFYLVGWLVLSLLALLLGGPFQFLMVAIIAALLPPAILSFMSGQRQRKFTSLLPDTLTLLAGTLRAGYSLLQGVEAVAQEVEDPMGRELRRVLAEARLGRPLEQALDEAAARMKSADFEWAVMAIRIQREVGGNLAELLDTVAETMLQRERLRREIRALTAEGRISALILGLLPVGLGLVMYSMNSEYMEPLLETGFGQALLIGAGLLAAVGFYWMKKTIDIEV